jgi:type IV fimbrial biogenesis protein FimT
MRRKHSGFTLVELMIVVVVIAVIATVAIPNLRQIVQKSQVKDASSGIAGAMMLARTQAIKQGRDVEVCTSTNGTNCTLANYDWENGWIVADFNTSVAITSTTTPVAIYRVVDDLDNDVSITPYVTTPGTTTIIGIVTYRSDGTAVTKNNSSATVGASATRGFTITNSCWSRDIQVGATGRVTTNDMVPSGGC